MKAKAVDAIHSRVLIDTMTKAKQLAYDHETIGFNQKTNRNSNRIDPHITSQIQFNHSTPQL
jgi:hypothetical protein